MAEESIHHGQQHRLFAWLAQVGNAAKNLIVTMNNGLSGKLGRLALRWLSVCTIITPVGYLLYWINQGVIPISLSLLVAFCSGLFGLRLSFHWEVNNDE
jgi:hypothetical protein